MTDAQNPGGWPDPQRPGVPMNPERDGFHWLEHRIESKPQPVQWIAEIDAWASGAAYPPESVVELGWRYLGPCLLPAKHAARVAEAKREGMREAAEIARRVPIPEDCGVCETHGRLSAGLAASEAILAAAEELPDGR